MKVTITMKTPDAVRDAIERAAIEEANAKSDLTEEERLELSEELIDQGCEAAAKWFAYGEQISLKLDTSTGDIEVLPR